MKVTLGQVAEVFSDGDWVESKDQDPKGDVRLIQLADVGDGVYLDKSDRFLTFEKAKELKCTFLEIGDILIARMPDPIGRACVFPGDSKRSVTVVDVCIVRADKRIVDPKWLLRKINSPEFRFHISTYATGTTRKRISRKNLDKIEFEVPPLAEQRRIAAVLDKAATLRRQRQQALAKLDTLLQAVFLDMFGDPVTNPKGWDTTLLSKIADIDSGVTKSRSRVKGKETVTVPYMRVANVQDGEILTSTEDIKTIEVLPKDVEKYRLQPNDILLTEGGDPDKLGRGGIWHGEIEDCIHQNHVFRVRLVEPSFLPEYLSSLISNEYGKRYFLKAAKQTTGIASINKTQLKAFPVLCAPVDLQVRFKQVVEKIRNHKLKLEQSACEIDQLFSSLQQRAFRGEL